MKNNKTKILFLGLCLGIASQSQSTDEELKKSGSDLHSSKDPIDLSPQSNRWEVVDKTYEFLDPKFLSSQNNRPTSPQAQPKFIDLRSLSSQGGPYTLVKSKFQENALLYPALSSKYFNRQNLQKKDQFGEEKKENK